MIELYIIKQETRLLKKFKMCVVLEDKIRGDTLLKEIQRKVFSSKDGTLEMRGILPLYI